jgi:hypothetical protein
MRRSSLAVFVLVVGLAALGSFLAFVWPTKYRAIAIVPSEIHEVPGIVAARQNRFTGAVEWLPALSDRWARGSDPTATATAAAAHTP